MMKLANSINFVIFMLVAFVLTGCLAANQEKMSSHSWSWQTFSYSKHDGVYVDGPIRWYEYCPYNNWIMTGYRPYGILGAIDLAFTPRYWFWYGHTGSNEYKYECEFLDGCEDCEKKKLHMIGKYKEWYPDEMERKAKLLKEYGTEDLLVHPKNVKNN